jgi:hypothetical protein
VHEQPVLLGRRRPVPEPVDQLVAVGCLEDRCERVLPVRLLWRGDREQVEIVVAGTVTAASPSAFTSRSVASEAVRD